MSHHAARRSTLAGSATGAVIEPAARAVSIVQSFSVLREGSRLQIRLISGRPEDGRGAELFGVERVFLRFAIVVSLLYEEVRQFALAPDQQQCYAPGNEPGV